MAFQNTGEMCMVTVRDYNNEDGIRHIDLGNYFISPKGVKCLITSKDNARKYSNFIKVPIYTMRTK
jgi:hypothetical protein